VLAAGFQRRTVMSRSTVGAGFSGQSTRFGEPNRELTEADAWRRRATPGDDHSS
jgi:hypothetical protein